MAGDGLLPKIESHAPSVVQTCWSMLHDDKLCRRIFSLRWPPPAHTATVHYQIVQSRPEIMIELLSVGLPRQVASSTPTARIFRPAAYREHNPLTLLHCKWTPWATNYTVAFNHLKRMKCCSYPWVRKSWNNTHNRMQPYIAGALEWLRELSVQADGHQPSSLTQ